ncbi:hypothetical protein LPJ38_24195 [Bradyrhizobium daqingense]|uniref:Rad52/22 family double-strand break repair protein n=1 Tax=Bradyrhizobium daqingense TaxID=993502 RepID=A0A562LBY9_9BRAD|nr:Rad52/Rad22 family DNA repair protein [Bradyrhizobium daqingense]TWI05140.1 Rad52/22 family double-strand break repair protein [Bradyrhizobium daqingense]UFS86758.1 hypothetical protein LPJ38_24195 [Bradyrhizobium daqingense]
MPNFETAQELFDELCRPFAAEEIEWRIGSTNADKTKGMALAYMDARAVMDRFDAVCGPDGWQCNYTMAGAIAICNIGVLMPSDRWIWKADGAGATDVEGEKGMLSDALKRAAVRWGVGRYLYEMDSPWVAIVQRGKSSFLADGVRKELDKVHEDFCLKAGWGLRAGRVAYSFANQVVKHFVTDALAAAELRERNAGTIAQMPVAMRKHLNDTLDRIGASRAEAAE